MVNPSYTRFLLLGIFRPGRRGTLQHLAATRCPEKNLSTVAKGEIRFPCDSKHLRWTKASTPISGLPLWPTLRRDVF